ncbi:MAG: winged helix-turn-helix transcriptional regulator, partial [Patescibacteria group bacterium]
IGVGKTTFVNYIKYLTAADNYFTPLGELSIQYDWTPEEFMFNTISIIYTAIERNKNLKSKFDSDLLARLNIIFGTERGYSYGGGASALGFGASGEVGKSFGAPRLNSHTLKLTLQEIIFELMKTGCGYSGVIIHYNNLELLQDKDENQLKRILNGVRDFMQLTGAHFIFVSDKKLYELFQQVQRVEDIFQVPIMLPPLSFGDIRQILSKRIKLLKAKPEINPIIPFEEDSLDLLFKLYSGNLRGVLRSLDCAVSETVKSRPVILSADILKKSLFAYAQHNYLASLGPKEDAITIKILKRILEKRETTNKLLAEHFKLLPQNVSSSLTKLREAGIIKLSRAEGRSRYYVPSQEAMWLLLHPSLD